jgi:MoaA/NifB/PqqE/SkfB family radical SAM enzyme
VSFSRGLKLAGFGTRYLSRMRRGRHEVMAHLAAPRADNLPMPTFVQLRVTNLCNLRCKMCGQWGDTGIFRSLGKANATDGENEKTRIRELIGLKREMGLDDYTRLLDELAPSRPIISLFGGEPLLYPDIVPLIQEVKRRGLTCSLITNSWHLESMARELVEAGIDTVMVSVDGPPDVHDRVRGREGSFERAASGVRALARLRDARGSAVPMLLAILPITDLNVDDVARALDALGDLPLDTINVGLRWFVPKETGSAYETVMKETFGVAGASWKGFEFDGADFAAAKGRQLTDLVKLLKGVRRQRFLDSARGRPWISFVPDVPAEGVPGYFADSGKTFGHDLCPVAWYFAQVEPDGQVCFCGDFPDYFIGNVRKTPFREIWTGERAGHFREKLAREPLPICSRCCGSFVYGAWVRPPRSGSAAPSKPLPSPGGQECLGHVP